MKKFLTIILACILAISFVIPAFALYKGDMNSNDVITSADALAILQYVVGHSTTIDKVKADMNSDGIINSYDALLVLKTSIGIVEPITLAGPYKVKRIVDGDTFVIIINNQEVKVRLIGVDTPESVATGANAYKNCEEGKIASNFTKEMLENKNIYLEYDVGPTDTYGRTLAYVYTDTGIMYNKLLLEKGYARMMTIQPNVKYVNDFKTIQETACKNKAGFWESYYN